MHVYINTLDLTCKGRKIFFFLKEEKDTCGKKPSQEFLLNFTYFLLLSFDWTRTYDKELMTHGHSKLKEIQVSRVCVEERDHKHLIL